MLCWKLGKTKPFHAFAERTECEEFSAFSTEGVDGSMTWNSRKLKGRLPPEFQMHFLKTLALDGEIIWKNMAASIIMTNLKSHYIVRAGN